MGIMKDKFTDKFIDISGKDFNVREQLNYNCVYYIKCGTGNNASDNYGNGYEGYSIIGKCYINKINEPIPETYLSVWVSLKKIAEGVFEATDEFIMGVKYVSVECIKDDFTLYYDKKLNKIYGNVTFEKNLNKMENKEVNKPTEDEIISEFQKIMDKHIKIAEDSGDSWIVGEDDAAVECFEYCQSINKSDIEYYQSLATLEQSRNIEKHEENNNLKDIIRKLISDEHTEQEQYNFFVKQAKELLNKQEA